MINETVGYIITYHIGSVLPVSLIGKIKNETHKTYEINILKVA